MTPSELIVAANQALLFGDDHAAWHYLERAREVARILAHDRPSEDRGAAALALARFHKMLGNPVEADAMYSEAFLMMFQAKGELSPEYLMVQKEYGLFLTLQKMLEENRRAHTN